MRMPGRSNPMERRAWKVQCFAYVFVLFVALAACSFRAPQASPPAQLLSLRLVHDSIRATGKESVVEATVQFMARNQSDRTVYGANACGGSPVYWVERREVDASGTEKWRDVFSAACIGRDIPRPLPPGDSSLFSSRIFQQFPGQKPEFAFSSRGDVYRFMYVVSTSLGPPGLDIQIISPPVVIRAPE
jgi:hypothetical protein